jgi:hypothetical protein
LGLRSHVKIGHSPPPPLTAHSTPYSPRNTHIGQLVNPPVNRSSGQPTPTNPRTLYTHKTLSKWIVRKPLWRAPVIGVDTSFPLKTCPQPTGPNGLILIIIIYISTRP